MRRIRFTEHPETVEAPRPVPGPGQLLVRTRLVGVHLGLVRMLRTERVAEPGGEMVGVVVEIGSGMPESWLGQEVGGVVLEGVYAEYVLATPALVTELPGDVDTADALAVVRGGLVALGALRAAGPLAGKSVLVTAAASGAGHLAVQIARASGARRVVGAVGSGGKAGFVRECGADAVVTYDQPWSERFDVIADGVGGALVPRAVEALAAYGRLVVFSAGGGTVEAGSLLANHKSVTGFSMGLPARTEPERIESYRRELWQLLADGAVRPRHTVYPLERIDAALASVEARRNTGRVAIRMSATIG
ncbi:quinone oxidoreductase family protein [Nocardia sp. NPDC002869]|uniref:quinone oxidoreductase family protein n=1 Tax=Nocardia sp. NPDC002869 TaxID=3161032 RepID=UPI00398CC69F